MKKKRMQKVISAGLSLVLAAGLTACGGSSSTSGGNTTSADYNLAKQCVFSEEPLPLDHKGDDVGIRLLTQQGDRVYLLYEEYVWNGNNSSASIKLMTMNTDGSDQQTTALSLYMPGEEPVISEEPAAAEQPVARTEQALAEIDMVDEGYSQEVQPYEYTGLGICAISTDGKLYGAKNHYKEDYSDPNNTVSVNENYICCWDMATGEMLWETPLENLQTQESYSYISTLVPGADGTVTVLLSGDQMEKLSVASDGTASARQPMPDAASILQNANYTFQKEEGVLSVIYWDPETYSKMFIADYDLTTDTATEGKQLAESFANTGYNTIAYGWDGNLVYSDSLGVYSYNLETQEATQMLSYINSDMTTTSMNNILVLDEDHMIGFYYDSAGGTKGGIFTRVDPADIPDKAVLVMAGNYIGYDVKQRIVEFNKASDQYRIVVKEYQSYNTMDDYRAGYTQLNNDIISGGMPDILVADNNIPIDSYIAKGLVADVDALIAEDEELSGKEFMQNAFEAYRVNGKLYYVIPGFYINTMIGKKSILGEPTTWTMQDMQKVLATMDEGTNAFSDMTRDNFMNVMMNYCGSDFVDVSTGKCNFDSDNFISMLEFATTLPAEFGEDYWGEDYWMNYQSQYRDDRTLLMSCYIGSVRDMNRNINGSFGEEISFVGFPTESGNGSILYADASYVLSAKSKNLDGAWQFMRYYLTDEYQDTLEYCLPVSKSAFMKKAEEATQNPYYLDAEGNKVEYEDTFYMNGEDIPLPNMTKEQVDDVVAFIETVTKRGYYDEDIMNIINEEAAAFFSGQKSARDVAGVIQSRAQIYVNENR